MKAPRKKTKTRDFYAPWSLNFLGLLLGILGVFLALVGFVGIFTSSGVGAIATLVAGGLTTVLGVATGSLGNRPGDTEQRNKGFFGRLIGQFIQFES